MYSGTGKSQPRVHRSSGKLGEALFPTGTVDPRVGISLSPLNTNDGFSLSSVIASLSTLVFSQSLNGTHWTTLAVHHGSFTIHMVQYGSHDRAAPAAPDLPCQKSDFPLSQKGVFLYFCSKISFSYYFLNLFHSVYCLAVHLFNHR